MFIFHFFFTCSYGWVIFFASFMCNMIVDGIAYTFGIFLTEFVKYFGEGKGGLSATHAVQIKRANRGCRRQRRRLREAIVAE